MLRVLTLSTLFPYAGQPTLGIFVERQTAGLAARDDVDLRVIAPVGLPIWPASLHPHYSGLARLPLRETWHGLDVSRPRFRVWPGPGAWRSAAALARSLLPLLRRMRDDFPFDVIDAEFFWPDGPAAVRLGGALGVPVSIKARGSDILYWSGRPGIRDQIVDAGRRAEGLLAVSGPVREEMVALGMPGDRIRVHHTGVDQRLFRPADRRAAKAAMGVQGPLLACAGALIPRKGQEMAIRALSELPGAVLVLAGEGAGRGNLERLARRLGLGDRVRMPGSLPPEELARILAAADVAVQPSSAEGLANVWVEAMACGTPVVTCDVGGAREAIDRPAAGRIVAREPAAIAAAVRDLLADPPAPETVRESAIRFSWERNRDELFDHLSKIAGREPAGS